MAATTTLDTGAVREDLQWALRRINSVDLNGSNLRRWLTAAGSGPSEGALRQFLLDALQELSATNAEGATILRRHYVDGAEVHIIARELALVEGTVNKKQREAVAQLAEVLARREEVARVARYRQLAGRLEAPTYSRLFGVERASEALLAPLMADGPPWLVAVDGMGGLGKTALADSLVRQVLPGTRWAEVAWVTARQQLFNAGGALQAIARPALTPDLLLDLLYDQLLGAEAGGTPLPTQVRQRLVRERLKAQPMLLVVDNLETATDTQALLATLRELAAPSKFLLTTRHSLHAEGDIFPFRLDQLEEADALSLVRWEAQMRNLPALEAAADEALRPIYAAVGGNPLALRLVVGQTHIHALGDILDDLRQSSSRRSEALYTYLYRQAWEHLDADAREALLLMPLVAEQGGDLAYLAALSGRAPGKLRSVLETLVTLNLVDRRGSLQESYYTIHSLTRTFLHEQVLRWQDQEIGPPAAAEQR